MQSNPNLKNRIYTINDKKILIEKINEIKDKTQIKKIKQIIFKENPDLSFTKNSSGILLFFHNLTNSTYIKLDDYFKILDQKRIDEITIRSAELRSAELRSSELRSSEYCDDMDNIDDIENIEDIENMTKNDETDIFFNKNSKRS
jgi:hypothetical protein